MREPNLRAIFVSQKTAWFLRYRDKGGGYRKKAWGWDTPHIPLKSFVFLWFVPY